MRKCLFHGATHADGSIQIRPVGRKVQCTLPDLQEAEST